MLEKFFKALRQKKLYPRMNINDFITCLTLLKAQFDIGNAEIYTIYEHRDGGVVLRTFADGDYYCHGTTIEKIKLPY